MSRTRLARVQPGADCHTRRTARRSSSKRWSLGVKDIEKPDFGDPPVFKPGEVPVFWACGVTAQSVAMAAKPKIMITHSPGHMFLTDIPNESLAVV